MSGLGRAFTLFITGQTISAVGSGMSVIVVPAVAYSATGSVATAGTVVGVGVAARLAARIPGGLLADRYDRRRLMINATLVQAGATGALAAAVASGRAVIFALLAAVVISGLAGAVVSAAELGALRHLVRPDQVGAAASMMGARGFVATLVGPLLAGLLALHGLVLPVVVDAISFAVAAAAVAAIRQPLGGGHRTSSASSHLRSGMAVVRGDPVLRLSALSGVGINFGYSGAITLVVLVSAQHGSGPIDMNAPVTLAVAAACGLIGSIAGVPLLARLPAGPVLATTMAVVAIGIFGAAATREPVLTGLCLGMGAMVAPIAAAILLAYQSTMVADDHIGSVSSAIGTLGSLAAPAGPVVAGWLLAMSTPAVTGAVLASAVVAAVIAASRPTSFAAVTKAVVRRERRPGSDSSVTAST